jgi:hypothetical protein
MVLAVTKTDPIRIDQVRGTFNTNELQTVAITGKKLDIETTIMILPWHIARFHNRVARKVVKTT